MQRQKKLRNVNHIIMRDFGRLSTIDSNTLGSEAWVSGVKEMGRCCTILIPRRLLPGVDFQDDSHCSLISNDPQSHPHRIACPGCSAAAATNQRRQRMFTRKWILISCAIPLPLELSKKSSAFNINFIIIRSKSNKSFSLETCFEQNKMCYTSKKKRCKKLKLSPSASSSSVSFFPFFFSVEPFS